MKTLKYLNLGFFILMLVVNALANIIPLGHGNTGSISNKYPNLFTPAPVTFSIWGVIYLLVAVFIFVQLGILGSNKLSIRFIELISFWFIASCILNIGWLISWHYESVLLSMILMVLLLFSLIMITSNLSINAIEQTAGISTTFFARISIYAFDIYLGWITAATIANASVLLTSINWNRFGLSEQFWTIAVLLVVTLIGSLFIITGHRYMSSAAIVWALCGILIKHISQSGYGGRYPAVIIVSIFGIIVIISVGGIVYNFNRQLLPY